MTEYPITWCRKVTSGFIFRILKLEPGKTQNSSNIRQLKFCKLYLRMWPQARWSQTGILFKRNKLDFFSNTRGEKTALNLCSQYLVCAKMQTNSYTIIGRTEQKGVHQAPSWFFLIIADFRRKTATAHFGQFILLDVCIFLTGVGKPLDTRTLNSYQPKSTAKTVKSCNALTVIVLVWRVPQQYPEVFPIVVWYAPSARSEVITTLLIWRLSNGERASPWRDWLRWLMTPIRCHQ